MPEQALQGKRIVVTGAGLGLGEAYAKFAAAEGASVLVNDIDAGRAQGTVDAIAEAGGTAAAFPADVSTWDSAKTIIDACIETFGGIDGLVNNAGLFFPNTLLEETDANIRKVIDVNLLGTIFVAAHAARAMVAAGAGGTIVNISSGNQAGHAAASVYGASKGAVSTLTYAWARELIEHDIRVNAFSPNAFTQQVHTHIAYHGESEHTDYPEVEHNAAAVAFLLSDASAQLNGQIFRIEAGKLNVMSHPLVVSPPAPVTTWSVSGVAEVLTDHLGAQCQPLGLAEARIEIVRELF